MNHGSGFGPIETWSWIRVCHQRRGSGPNADLWCTDSPYAQVSILNLILKGIETKLEKTKACKL